MRPLFTFRLATLIFSLILTAQLGYGQITEDFITTWEVTDDNLTVKMSRWTELQYNYSIDWGDGTKQSSQTGSPEHTYSRAGTYTIKIDGFAFPGIRIVNAATRQIRTVEQWGNNRWETFEDAFKDCADLVINATDAPNLGSVRSMDDMFNGATRMTGDFSQWSTRLVTSMESMFQDANSFNSDLSNWDVGNVTNMRAMFSGATAFNSDLSDWDVTNVTDMSLMFDATGAFNSNLNDWNVSKVTDMQYMFNRAAAFNSDLDDWNVGNVTNVSFMFNEASAFNGKLTGWNLSKVTSLEKMFYKATSFNGDVSGWKVQNVTEMIQTFWDATSFNQPLNDWDVSSVTDMSSMFNSASSFNQDLDKWNTANVTKMTGMFNGAIAFNGNIGTWNVSKVTSLQQMFGGASAFNSDISAWDVSSANGFASMFSGASAFNADISNWDVSGLIEINNMFQNATVFNQPIGKWDIQLAPASSSIFENAAAFDQNLGNWNVESASSMNGLFSGSGMSVQNYNATLFGWSQQSLRSNVSIDVDGLEYCNIGELSRQKLIADFNWTFSGDSEIQCPPTLFSGVKDSDSQLTVTFDVGVKTNEGNPTDFTVMDAFGTNFAVAAQADGTAGDSEVVLTVANLSAAIGDLTVSYTNNNSEIKDTTPNELEAGDSDIEIDTDTEAPTLVSAIRDSDTQITLTFNEPVQTKGGGLFAFTVTDDDNNSFEVTAQADGTARDNQIVLTVEDLSPAVGLITFNYINNTQISDFGDNLLDDASALVCADGFSCNLIVKTLCVEESYTLNSGQVVINPEQLVQVDTVGTVITQYRFTVDKSVDCCPDGFTCDVIDVNSCAFPYTSPLGNTSSVEGRVIDMDITNQIRNVYNVTFDRAEPTVDVFQNATIAESGSVTYDANTNATGVLTFDKDQDHYVDLDALQDDLNGKNRSVFMWIKSEANVTTRAQVLFGINYGTSSSFPVSSLYIDPSGDVLKLNASGSFRSTSISMNGEVWNYVGYTYNATSSETSVYINGILATSFTRSQPTDATSRYSLGQEFINSNSTDDFHYNGDMAEVSVWNEELTGAEVRAAMQEKITNAHPAHDHLVGYYSVFGVCNDDPTVLKDHSGKGNNGVMRNGFTQDFKNVQAIEGFNAAGWYDSFSWKKDGTELGTEKTFSTQVAAGSYEFTASRNYMQSTDSWTMTTNSNATTVDNIADETICEDGSIIRTVTDFSLVDYLEFEEAERNYVEINGLADEVAGKSRSVFMWYNKESGISSGDFNELLVFQDADVSKMSRFYVRSTERLALWDGSTRINSRVLSNETWYFVGYTYDQSTGQAKVYVNGTEDDSGTLNMPLGDGWITTLGSKFDGQALEDFLDGKLAEITVWDKVLTAEEITAIMKAAPAHDAANLVGAYGTNKNLADNHLRDLTVNGNDGLVSHESIIFTEMQEELADYDASANYTFSWKNGEAEFDTDATGNINVEEGTTAYSVTYGTPLFQKTDAFNLSYTNLIPTQPTGKTVAATATVTFEVEDIPGASYQWYKREEGFDNVNLREDISVATSYRSNDGTLFLGTRSDGLFISTNDGESFTNITTANGLTKNDVSKIYEHDGRIYVVQVISDLSVSDDGGQTFTPLYEEDATKGQSAVSDVYVDDNMIFLATGFLRVSDDGGRNFNVVANGGSGHELIYQSNGIFYFGTSNGLSISTDGGQTFTQKTTADGLIDNHVRAIHEANGVLYVATQTQATGGLSISTNGGASFDVSKTTADGLGSNFIRDIKVHNNVLYVATTGGISMSTDGGATFTNFTESDGLSSQSINSLYVYNDQVEMGTQDGMSVYRSNLKLDDSASGSINQIEGATTHKLTIDKVSLDQNATEYFVVVTKDGCEQKSDDLILTVLDVPAISIYTPENGSTDIAIDTELRLRFNRSINIRTGEIKIFNYATDALVQTFTAGDLTKVGTEIRITSGVSLDYATQYYLTLDADLVVDNGNAGNLAITDKDRWSFHTICEPLVLTEPEDQTGFIAGSASFSVPEVAGASYQWFNSLNRTDEVYDFSGLLVTDIYANESRIHVTTGFDKLFTSTDRGTSFTENVNITGKARKVIEFDGVLYVATQNAGLAISTDNGATFEYKNEANNGLADDYINNIYVSNGVLYVSTSSGLSISTDNGESFETRTTTDGLGNNSVQEVYAAGSTVYVANLIGGLGVSTDGGKTFTSKGSGNGLTSSISELVVASDGTIYVGGVSVFVSQDGGESFTELPAADQFLTKQVFDLDIENDILYINVQEESLGAAVYSTADQGNMLTTRSQTDASGNRERTISVLSGQVFAGGYSGKLVKHLGVTLLESGTDATADNYVSGVTTATLTFNNLTEEFDQSDYFVVVTKSICEETSETVTLTVTCEPLVLTQPTDQTSPINGTATFLVPAVAGATYQWLGTDAELTQLNAGSNFGQIEDAYSDGSNWYIARSNGFFVSNDGGENFVEKGAADGLDADDFVKVTGLNGNVYVADKNAVFVSTDNGQSFQEIYSSGRLIVTLYVDANAIYVGTTTGLGVSTDGGTNFSFKGTGDGLASSYIRSVSGSNGKVYVGANDQISVSSDNGTSFEKLEVHSADKGTVTDVLAVGSKIYVTTTQGLYISTDNGQNFTLKEETEGFELKYFTTISLTAEGFIMLGAANSGGLFSSLDEGNSFNKIQSATSGFSSIVKTFTSGGKDYVVNSGSIYQAETPIELIATQTDNNAISGVDTNTLTISNLSDELDQSSYFVVVTKGDCEETSVAVTLTVGEVAPTIATLLPADDAVNVSNNPDISITFDQAIVKGTGNIEVRRASDDQLLVEIAATSAQVSIEGQKATLSLGDTNLELDTEYYITIPNTAFENASGVAFAGISDKTTWSFTTVEALELISLSPENGATGVTENAFTMVFNHPVEVGYPPTIRLMRTDDDVEVALLDHLSSFVEFSEDKKTVEFYFVDENDQAIELELGTGYYILLENYFRAPLTGEFFSISQKTDWAFTTAETSVSPLLFSNTDPSETRDARIDFAHFRLFFDESVEMGTGTLTIYKAADNSVFESFDATDFSLSNSNKLASVSLSQDYELGVAYYVQYPQGFIRNEAGTKALTAVNDNTSFTFNGESIQPSIIQNFFPATGSKTYVADSGDDFVLYTSESVSPARDLLGTVRVYRAATNELVKTFELDGENDRDLDYPDDDSEIRFEFATDELESGTEYYVLIDDGFIVSYDNEYYHVGISDPNTWRFTTLAIASTPTLTNTSPATGANDVNISADIELTYSENIQAHVFGETMNVVNNLVLYDADNNVVETFPANSLSYSGAKVTINPTNDLDFNTTYYLLIDAEVFISNNRITTAAVTDPTAISFTTGSQLNTAPVASAQDFTGNLEVNQQLTGSYTYTDADTDAESGTAFQWYIADDAAGANSTAISGATAQNYTLTSSEAGKYIALAITPNDGMDAGTEVFTTYKEVVPAVIPTLVSTVPADEAKDIVVSNNLSFVMSEPVTKGNGNIILTPTNGGPTVINISASAVNVSGTNVTIDPTTDLLEGKFYTVTFDATAFVDVDGNNSAGLTSRTAWNFTTKEAQVAPVATAVSINRSTVVNAPLEGSYSYSDGNDDPESGSTYQWYRADDASGTNKTAISGAISEDYVAQAAENNKYVSFEVTPNDGNQAGTAVESAFFGPVLIDNGVTNIPPAFTSDPLVTTLDNVTYSYTITTEDRNSHAVSLTKTTGPAWLTLSAGVLSGNPAGQIGEHAIVLTADDGNGGTKTQEFTITVEASNTAPSVNGIEVTGTTTIDEQLTGTYNFIDAENDADNSNYKWYRADDNAGTNKTAIEGATVTTYTLTSADAGKFISFEVTPNDSKVDGTLAESTVVGAVDKKTPTLSLSAITKVYGDADFDLAASTNSTGAVTYAFDNDQTSANLSGATVTLGNVGEITVDVNLAEDAEYQARQVQGKITVAKRAIEVTATNASKGVGATDPTLAFTVSSGAIVGSDEVVTVSRDAGEAVGTYAMTFTDGTAAANYDITKVDGLFTINAVAITVTADAATKTYGAADPAFTYNITTGALNGEDVLSGAITREAGEDVGTYALQSGLFNADYDITFVPANLTVGKADLTVTANDQTKFIGEANPALTISYTGFVNGDTETNITAPTIATLADESSLLGTYDITLSGGAATNYNLSLVNGTLTVAQRPFITTWEINSSQVNRSRTYFRGNADYTFSYTVDWGDGNIDQVVIGDANHTYAAEGTYTVKVTGDFPKLEFGQSSVSSIDQWGDIEWESMENALIGASTFTLNATDAPDLSNVTSLRAMFERTQVGNPDLTGWDVSTITDMSEMFMESDFNGNISSWDLSAVTNMSFMFAQTANFNSDITGWNTSGVQDMSYVFYFAEVFNQAIDSWNVSSVANMNYMFADAAVFNQDLNSWNVGSVTTMEYMFDNALLFNGNITSWDVSSVTDMSNMFDDSKVFNQDIDGWDVSNVTEMNAMFNDAEAFNQDLNSWNTSKVTTFVAMFQNTDVFNGAIGNWDISNATRLERMFEDAHAFNQDISNWQPTNTENLTAMFRDARAFNQDISSWRFPNADRLNQMFYEAAAFNQDISSWETGNIVDMSSMFEEAEAFNQDISSWDVSAVTSFGSMFRGTLVFNQDISGWDMSATTGMSSMFKNAKAFNQDVSGWTFAGGENGLTSMSSVFENATAFDQDLSNWDITNISGLSSIFSNSGMSIASYDATLIGWAAQEVQDEVEFGVEGLQYCAGNAARQSLIDDHNWTIENDSQSCTATVTIADVSGNEDDGNITVTLASDAFVVDGFTVDVSTANGTATAGTDYTAVTSQTITFAGTVGEVQTFTITPTSDTDVEGNETLTVGMSNLVTGTDNTVTITDDATITIVGDDQPVVSFASTAAGNSESTTSQDIEVTLNQAGLSTTTVDYTVTGTATGGGTDYTLTAGTLNFAAGDLSETINLVIIDDAILEGNETVVVTLSNPSGATLGTTTVYTYTITDNDVAAVTIADVSGTENGGAITLTATLDNAVAGGFTVDVSTLDGTATTADGDYTTITSQTLTFAGTAGEAQTFTVLPTADTKVEADETVIVSMSGLGGTSLAVAITDNATITINNDDAATVSFENTESNGLESVASATVPVALSTASVSTITIDYAVSGTASGSDYTLANGTLTFAAGETVKNITIASIVDDAILEGNETVIVTLSNPSGATLGTNTVHTYTIIDNDAATVTMADISGNEGGGPITVTATLDNAVVGGFTVEVNTADGTATVSAGDYTAVISQTLTFAGTAGETQAFTVIPTDDLIIENDEVLTVSMSNLSTSLGVDITGGAIVTIVNDDFNNFPTDISLSANSIAENNALDATIGNLTTTDADAGNTHSYSLVAGAGDTDNATFTIDGAALRANNSSFNFEDRTSYSIRVQTDDGAGGTFEKAFIISITNVNESPFTLSLTNSTIDESDEAQEVGSLMSLDPDNGDSFTYSLVAGEGDADNALFVISGSTLNTAGAIDFEEGDTRSIRIRVTDAGGLTFEMAFTITIEDVMAEPVRDYTTNVPGGDVKNVFSPNGDGVNETWVIEDLLDNPFNEVKIFAQGGKLIYNKVNYTNDWGGTFRDDPVPDGTYYYEISIFENAQSTTPARVIKGFLTIIRNR